MMKMMDRIDKLNAAIERSTELLGFYEGIGPNGHLAAGIIKDDITAAERAIHEDNWNAIAASQVRLDDHQ